MGKYKGGRPKTVTPQVLREREFVKTTAVEKKRLISYRIEYAKDEKCPECGSKYVLIGFRHSYDTKTHKLIQLCDDCGHCWKEQEFPFAFSMSVMKNKFANADMALKTLDAFLREEAGIPLDVRQK